MAFYILPHPANPIQGRYADHGDIRLYLGLARDAKLPLDFTSSCTWVPLRDGRHTVLICKPGNPAPEGPRRWRNKSSAHRCYVSCPDCAAVVPAGRTHQHKCKPTID